MESIVTVDGPAASGKSALCQRIARILPDWDWLSTGVFYRGLAYIIVKEKLESEEQWVKSLTRSPWEVKKEKQQTTFWYAGKNLTSDIYNIQIDAKASEVARCALVRSALIHYQKIQKEPHRGLIAEGRDCGTVVFPSAPLKIYLTAQDQVRAERRAKERNQKTDFIMSAQKKRDKRDSERTIAPLKIPKGAWLIQTDQHSLDEIEKMVVEKIKNMFSIL